MTRAECDSIHTPGEPCANCGSAASNVMYAEVVTDEQEWAETKATRDDQLAFTQEDVNDCLAAGGDYGANAERYCDFSARPQRLLALAAKIAARL